MTKREKILEIYESKGIPEKIRAYLKEEMDFFDSQGKDFWERLETEKISRKNPNNILIFHLLDLADKPSEWRHKWVMSDPPDIDVDLESDGRDKVIEYLKNKYGDKRVLQIGTIGSIKIKSAIIDISRVLGIDPSDVLEVTTSMEGVDESATMDELKKGYPKLKNFLVEYPEIENHLHKLLGSFRHYCLGENTAIRVLDNKNNGNTINIPIKALKAATDVLDLVYLNSKGELCYTNNYQVFMVGEDWGDLRSIPINELPVESMFALLEKL